MAWPFSFLAARTESDLFACNQARDDDDAHMQVTEEKQNLRCDNILVTARGVAETSGKKVMIFVPAAEIQRITLRYGRSEHRPIFSISVGVIFVLIGIFGLVEFFLNMRAYRYELAMMVFGVIGASLIFDALKQSYFLEVQCAQGARRLVFSKHASKSDIQTFCESVRKIYGFDISEAS
jgi:hypothetical protein